MAARKTKFLSDEHRLYVYQITDNGVPVYIGKGSGYRLQCQMKKFGLPGNKIKTFKTDKEAYQFEKEMIARYKPEHNVCAGGNGPSIVKEKPPKKEKWMIDMAKMGHKRYAAQFLLKRAVHLIDSSKIDTIRQVANGSRS